MHLTDIETSCSWKQCSSSRVDRERFFLPMVLPFASTFSSIEALKFSSGYWIGWDPTLCFAWFIYWSPAIQVPSHGSKFNAPLCSVGILVDLSVKGLKPVAHLHDLWLSSEVFQTTSSTSFSYSLMSYECGFEYSGMPLCNCGCLCGLLMVDTTKKQSDGTSKV
jgi:hypothetical protein